MEQFEYKLLVIVPRFFFCTFDLVPSSPFTSSHLCPSPHFSTLFLLPFCVFLFSPFIPWPPPFLSQIFDVQFNPHSSGSLVTCGVKHIKFWTLCGNSLSGKKGIFGKKGWGVSEREGEGRREGERREGERGERKGERGEGERKGIKGGRGVKEGGRRGKVRRERTEGKGI